MSLELQGLRGPEFWGQVRVQVSLFSRCWLVNVGLRVFWGFRGECTKGEGMINRTAILASTPQALNP